MPKFCVAYNNEGEVENPLAATSIQNLKVKLKEHPSTTWTIAVYNTKFDLKTVLQIIEDISEVEAEESFEMKVTDSGQCRKVE